MNEEKVIINNDNIDNYYNLLVDYATYELWFYNNSHVDYAEVDEDTQMISVYWVFRADEIPSDDWQQYEDDGFPDDVDSFEISVMDFEDYLESQNSL